MEGPPRDSLREKSKVRPDSPPGPAFGHPPNAMKRRVIGPLLETCSSQAVANAAIMRHPGHCVSVDELTISGQFVTRTPGRAQ